MTGEFVSVSHVRFFTESAPKDKDEEWIYVLDELPREGERVLCHGNKTICCELDMDEATEHEAIFKTKMSSWRERPDGSKYDVKTYADFEIQDEGYHLIFVSRWKRIKK